MRWLKLAMAIAACQLAGVLGSLFTFPKINTWYAALNKPQFTLPNWLFGPVWITLYALMGIALYFFLESGKKGKKSQLAFSVFCIQLALNALWSFFFFGLESPFLGLITIALLWFAIALTIFTFFKISKKSALLLLPYLLWVSFAMLLNYSIWVLNP